MGAGADGRPPGGTRGGGRSRGGLRDRGHLLRHGLARKDGIDPRHRLLGRLDPSRAILGQHPQDEPGRALGDLRPALAQVRRRLLLAGDQDLRQRRSPMRGRAREDVTQRRSERVEVGAHVEVLAPGLLRRHVVGRSDRRPRAGQRPLHRGVPIEKRRATLLASGDGRPRGRILDLLCPQFLGQPQVGEFRDPLVRQDDVRGLDVAVQDPEPARVLQGLRDLARDAEGALLLEGAFHAQDVLDGPARHELHHEVGRPVRIAEVDPLDDVLVLERGGRARLPLESFDEGGVPGNLRGEELESDNPAGACHLRPEYNPHRPLPEPLEDLVAPDPGGIRWGHGKSWRPGAMP